MLTQHNISEYIDNLKLKKRFGFGFRPKEVYKVIRELMSMYNELLSGAYEENEKLKQRVQELESEGCAEKKTLNVEETQKKEHSEIEHVFEHVEKKRGTQMTDKELQRLKRGELLELLLEQSKENERLKKQVEELNEDVADLRGKLTDRRIELDKAGTIAEAAFRLNGVYAAAESAAKQYLENLEVLYIREEENCTKKEAETEAYVQKLLQDTQNNCDSMQKQTEDRCAAMQQAVQERCDAMKEDAKQECDEMISRVQQECDERKNNVTQECDTMLSHTEQKCMALKQTTDMYCEEREKESEERCKHMEMKAEEAVEKRWNELSRRLEEFYKAHVGLRELLTSSGQIQRD